MNDFENKILKEIESMKKEIENINKKIEKNDNSKGKDFDFQKYKEQVNVEDIEKLRNFNKIKPVWFIPIIGSYWFDADLGINLESIDRGLVRSEWVKTNWHFVLLLIPIYIISILINIKPFFQIYFIRKIVLKKVEKKVGEKNE